jgi:hypothetical protein
MGVTPELYYHTRADQERHITHLDRTIAKVNRLIEQADAPVKT